VARRLHANVENLPDNIGEVMEAAGVFVPDDVDETVERVITRAAEGRCMTCNAPLAGDTVICLTSMGVLMAFCSAPCMQDMTITQWLQEQFDDIVEHVKFRGGAGDVADEKGEDDGEVPDEGEDS
jgi:hypothetical protein